MTIRTFWALAVAAGLVAGISACGSGKKAPALSSKSTSEKSEAKSEEKSEPKAERAVSEERSSSSTATAGGIDVTRVTEKNGEYEIVLNGCLAVKGVKVRSSGSGEFLAFPAERDKEGKFSPFIRVGREDGEKLLTQVKDNAPASGAAPFTVTSAKAYPFANPTGARRAFVRFELNDGALTLSSWVIVMGKKGLFLGTPSMEEGGEWVDVVYPVSKELREELQTAALAAYKDAGGTE